MYVKKSLYLTSHQLKKIRAANQDHKGTTIRIDPKRKTGSMYQLYLTQRQVNKLGKAVPFDMTLSKTQLEKNGGFIFSIPAILAGVGAAAGLASSAATIAKAVNTKKHEKLMESEAKRHNKKLESLLTKGKGIYLPGKKLLLKK